MQLQHEIMRKTPDLSLFAFGGSLPLGDLSKHGYTLRPEATIFNGDEFLLASSPRRFRSAYNYTPNLGSNARQRYPPDPVRICLSFLLPRLSPLLNRTYQLPLMPAQLPFHLTMSSYHAFPSLATASNSVFPYWKLTVSPWQCFYARVSMATSVFSSGQYPLDQTRLGLATTLDVFSIDPLRRIT